MPRYFCPQYDTDMGYSLYAVALDALTVVSVASGKKAEDFLPQNLTDLYQSLNSKTVTCSTVGISLRYVYLWVNDGTEHQIHLPINGFDPRWNDTISQYKNDSSILKFRVGGERIKEGRLTAILNK